MPRDLLAEAPRTPRDLLAAAQPAQQPQAATDKAASVLAEHPTPHKGYAAQVREMAAAGPSKGTAMPWDQIGKQWLDTAEGVPTGVALGVPSAVAGAPGDVEGVGRSIAHAFNKDIPTETALPTSSGIMDALAGKPENEQVAGGRLVGSMLSPAAYTKGAELVGKGAGWTAKQYLGLRTGAGPDAIQGAYDAGKQGGQAADAFQAQMTGSRPAADVVQTAKDAVAQLKADRSATYKANAANFKGDTTVLDFTPIDQALNRVAKVGSFGGKSLSEGADKAFEAVHDAIMDWKNSDPATFHTAEGLDALKQKISDLVYNGSLQTAAAPGSRGRAIVNDVKRAISDTITKQAPGYAKTMADYHVASDTLDELERGLSLKESATVDTALRKLQSIMRNNANTNYGQRAEMGKVIDTASNGMLTPQLAGQALNSWTPRGLNKVLMSGEAGSLGPTVLLGHPGVAAGIAADLTTSSPRLVGNLAYGAGKLGRGTEALAAALSKATHVNSATAPALIGNQQLLARLLAQQPAPAGR